MWDRLISSFSYNLTTLSGAAYCQIIDSIFRDVPLTRVKFDTKGEHENVANFKILQSAFDKHKIDKLIPVEKLVKMKMQDNLDFLQWIKRYWEANNTGEPYDPLARRKAAPGTASAGIKSAGATRTVPARRPANAPSKPAVKSSVATSTRNATNNGATSRASQITTPSGSRPPSEAKVLSLQREVDDLTTQLINLNVAHESLAQEREFYYNKLREVEILIQQHVSSDQTLADSSLVKGINNILYSTDDGFELPAEEDIEHLTLPEGMNEVMDDIF